MKITSIVIAKNEEQMIGDCITSLEFCDEVLVVDNGSVDKTIQIAKDKGAKVIKVDTDDFSKLRNEGIKKTNSDWVLYIDADERVTGELANEIKETINNPGEFKAFKINRKNYYLGDKEWPKIEKLERLFEKDSLKDWYGKIHESPKVEGRIGELKGYMLHFTHKNLSQMLSKTIEWSEIEADLRFNTNHPKMIWWRFPRVMTFAFFDSYFRQGGYKIGTAGLIESIYQTFSIFITYAKLWEKQNEYIKDKKSN